MIRTLRNAAIATALLLAAGNAWALGLGQIEVKSRRNQPLLAEIPIVSTTPGELEALQARLASPETFRRVGLAPPSGIAADLQFSLGNDARGRPVIRVTTVRPVDQAVLNFLIEVDWGQGRLVREYSALVDAPNTASAPVQPAIEAPVAPAPNTVQRPQPAPPVAAAPAAQPPAPTPAPAAAEPPPPSVVVAPLPETRGADAAPSPAPTAAPRQYGPIRQGETLSVIAGGLGLTEGHSLDQAMLALLRANPDAFLGDDINRLKRGAVLRVPGSAEVAQVDAAQASQVVREQMQQWRQARRAVRQPDAASTSPAARQAGASDATAPAIAKPVVAKPAAPRPAAVAAAPKPKAAAPRASEARLQIIPPTAPGKANGTRSGTAAGGEGSMLQQQLRQKDEEIASKSAEIGELKERVAELEKMRQDQQQLLTLKDSELAAAQQRLAEANKAAASSATAAKPAAQATQPAAAQAASTQKESQPPPPSPTPYLWGGIGVIALGVLAWLLMGRRKPAPPARRSAFDSEALAASLVAPTLADPEPETEPTAPPEPQPTPRDPTPAAPAAVPVAGMQSDPPTIDLASVPPTAARIETPTWHSGWVKTAEPEPPQAAAAQPRFVPLEDPLPEPAAPPSADQRMKLARAFLDIGDDHSARQLLRELLDDKDPVMRNDAARMLRELG